MSASRVRFNPVANFKLIPTVAEMSPSEIAASFYSDQEFNKMQADTVRTIRAMRRGRPLNEGKYCSRGLEQLTSQARLEQRTANRNNVIGAVLVEQERQWAVGNYRDEGEIIAKASRAHSQWARGMALEMGISDAAWVRSMVQSMLSGRRQAIVKPVTDKKVESAAALREPTTFNTPSAANKSRASLSASWNEASKNCPPQQRATRMLQFLRRNKSFEAFFPTGIPQMA